MSENQDVASIVRRGADPLLVFLHGLQGTKELFVPLLESSYFENRAVLVPDLPGFGDSSASKASGYSIASYAELIERMTLDLGHREVAIVGHSLGGMIGVRLLKSAKLRVKALISLEGNLALGDCGASLTISESSKEEFIERMLPQIMSDLGSSTEASARTRYEALSKALPDAVHEASKSIVDESKAGLLLKEFVAGKASKLLLVGAHSSFSTRLLEGNIQTTAVPEAGHFMLHDNFEFTANVIVQFLSGVSKS